MSKPPFFFATNYCFVQPLTAMTREVFNSALTPLTLLVNLAKARDDVNAA